MGMSEDMLVLACVGETVTCLFAKVFRVADHTLEQSSSIDSRKSLEARQLWSLPL